MSEIDPVQVDILEDGAVACMARLTGWAGTAVTTANVTAVGWGLYDLGSTSPTVAIASSTSLSSVIYSTLQTGGWTKDTTGYNFRHIIGSTLLSAPNRNYVSEYRVTPSSTSTPYPYSLPPYQIHTRPRIGS